MTRKYKNILTCFLIIIGTVIFALIIVEIGIRLYSNYGRITPALSLSRSLEYEPSIFCRHVFPRKEKNVTQCITEGYEAEPKYHINPKGYRGKDFSIIKPEEAIRIIIYGGSSVFDTSAYINENRDWPHKVEDLLHGMGYPWVEIINGGIPGHASFDSLGRLYAEGHHFNPDYVLIYNAWNDIKYFRSKESLLRQFKPLGETADPRLHYKNWLDKFICEHSWLYERLRSRYFNRKLRLGREGVKPESGAKGKISDEAVEQYRLTMEMFVDLARNIGAVPVLMTQARLIDRDNSEEEKARISYDMVLLTPPALCRAFEATDEVIYSVSREKDVPLIDASRFLSGNGDLFEDHVHLSHTGSASLAELTARKLAELIKSREQEGK